MLLMAQRRENSTTYVVVFASVTACNDRKPFTIQARAAVPRGYRHMCLLGPVRHPASPTGCSDRSLAGVQTSLMPLKRSIRSGPVFL